MRVQVGSGVPQLDQGIGRGLTVTDSVEDLTSGEWPVLCSNNWPRSVSRTRKLPWFGGGVLSRRYLEQAGLRRGQCPVPPRKGETGLWGRGFPGHGAEPKWPAASALSPSPGCGLLVRARPPWLRWCCCGCWGCRGSGAQQRRSVYTWAAAAGVSCASSARLRDGTCCECSPGLVPGRAPWGRTEEGCRIGVGTPLKAWGERA